MTQSWEPQYGVPNGGKRPDSALSPYVARMKSALVSFAHRFDSWANPITGFGTTRDKTTYGVLLPNRLLVHQELADIYHHDDMAARMVDVVPQEMLREPFDVVTGNAQLDAILADKIEELLVRERYSDGMRWGRAFGGGVCLIGADDGRDAREELKAHRARDVEYLYDIDGRYVWPISYYEELGHPKLGQPRTYMVTTIGGWSINTAEVHESRLVVFHGAPTAARERMLNRGWSFSVLQRAYAILRQFNSGWTSVENMLVDGSQAVFKMGGLAEMIGAQGEDLIQSRMRAMDFYRSNIRAIVIDADAKEEFGRQAASFEQIPNVLDKFMLRLAATVEIPVTILMGQSPAGMNATGESDFRWFYDRIRAQQTTMLAPKIRKLVAIWLRTKAGQEALRACKLPSEGPETLNVNFPPLWTETPSAKADRELKIAQTDQVYLSNNVFTPEEVALTRGRPDGFSMQVQLTDEQLEMRETMASVSAGLPTTEEGTETAPPTQGDVVETLELSLTPSDLAAITKVNEARAKYGLRPLPGPDGDLTLPAFKAKYSEVIAASVNAEAGQPDGEPPPTPAPGGFGGGPPPNAKSDDELGRPSSGEGDETIDEEGDADTTEERTDAGPQAACVLVFEGPLVLAVSRKDDPNAFGLPGGKVDPGETPMQAAIRELKEETGYDGVGLQEVFVSKEADGFTTTTFKARVTGSFNTSESGQVSWVHPEALFRGPFGDYNRRLWAKLGLETDLVRVDAKPRTFVLQRDVDESGVSGTGEVAHGVLFDDGKVAMRWRTETAATTLFDSIDHVLKVHGHGGKTRIVWDDEGEKR